MAFSVAANFADIMANSAQNVFTLWTADPDVDMLARLVSWRVQFFALLNQDIVDQKVVHQWIVPNLALEAELSNSLTWWQAQEIVNLLQYQTAAIGFDGNPNVVLEPLVVAVYNPIWAAL